MSDYFLTRDQKNIEKLRELLGHLPPLCREFFLGIEQRTTPLTRLNYGHDLIVFFNFLSENVFQTSDVRQIDIAMLNRVTASDLERYLDYLTFYQDSDGIVHHNGEKSKARHLATVRSLFKYFFNKDYLTANVATKVAQPKLHDKEIIRLEPDEVSKLLDAAEEGNELSPHQCAFHTLTKNRDVAILTLFLGTGIRISELVGLNVNDINFADNSFRVTRKGGNQVILYFGKEVASALSEWIQERNDNHALQYSKETALFISLRNSRISVRAVENLVKKYAKIVSPLKKISPHKLRSTYGTNLYRETKDIYVVAEVLGHKDVNTTKKHYAAISEDIRRGAASKVVLRQEEIDNRKE